MSICNASECWGGCMLAQIVTELSDEYSIDEWSNGGLLKRIARADSGFPPLRSGERPELFPVDFTPESNICISSPKKKCRPFNERLQKAKSLRRAFTKNTRYREAIKVCDALAGSQVQTYASGI